VTSPLVTYAVDGRVGVVSLNRGDKLNAISGDRPPSMAPVPVT
jgi:enoyl-CoA hydratase/carnithine racemase